MASQAAIAGPSKGGKNPSKLKGKKHHKKSSVHTSKLKRNAEKRKTVDLEKAAQEFTPSPDLKAFNELPISDYTLRGLKKAFFTEMTDIQAQSIPLSLKGKDVLGAARTGSGKTLAFLIPVLEILYRQKWGQQDGLGALIISPTRELAVQIFDVLRSIGGYHTFSAGLVIGGKNLKDERDRLSRMNILVATPGRLLQHMDQTVGFDADNLQMLVLDEADRILDMGFSRTVTALLGHLPKSRQTLLFSATLTQSVTELARLSLKDPIRIGIHDHEGSVDNSSGGDTAAIPKSLEQHYAVCELDRKLDILWSFIKTHLHSKTLVFISSGKQVRFVFETFCRMHPGIPLLQLHGKQKQTARLDTFSKFSAHKHAVLFATDIAARGLDFPGVEWVLQVDAPEDVETYIHRVGRTARYESAGQSLLLLCPSEEDGMMAALAKKGIDVRKIKIKASKTQSIQNQLQRLAFQDPEIKYLGQRAFVSYMRSIYLHKDKSIFKLNELPSERYADSLGLPGAPKIKFLNKDHAKKNASRTVKAAQDAVLEHKDSEDESKVGSEENEGDDVSDGVSASGAETDDEPESSQSAKSKKPVVRTKYDKMFERKNQNILSEHYTKLIDRGDDFAEGDDDFFTIKRANHDVSSGSELEEADEAQNLSKRKQKLGRAKRTIAKSGDKSKRLVFDEDGNAHEIYELEDVDEFYKDGLKGAMEAGRQFAQGEREKMQVADAEDKQQAKEKKKEKKRKRKERERGTAEEPSGGPTVGAFSDDDDGYISPEFNLPSMDDDEEAAFLLQSNLFKVL